MIMKTTEMLAEEMPLTQRKEELKKMADAYEGKQAPQVELQDQSCLLYTSPSPRDATLSRMPSSA